MKGEQKTLARKLFRLKIHESDGNAFEDLFTQIMNYAEPDFQQIKPWGNIGDRKNDGYIRSKGVFFQVYAPIDIIKSYPDTVKKLIVDFNGLLSHKQWKPIREFYFVVNDKYKGVNPDATATLDDLIFKNKLLKGKIITPKDLERILFSLNDDEIFDIVGILPNLENINIDFSVITEVISHIKKLPFTSLPEKLTLPDWNEKINFNNLNDNTRLILNNASMNLGDLNEYLSEDPFLGEELQIRMVEIYQTLKIEYQGDDLFWNIVKKCCPRLENQFISSISVIMAKYFECCDIFEEPIKIYK
ncbi:hypothetical protein K4L44_07500 [Halosquirtibacter laminarini]|uniref:Uncharacterized protein n=1 Tax=Halosquirtibacter laminarini TaxID=3374600 RepID=A0AC61NJF9_9BACT|nr:hypothetical protein K4L44_07500 [Prolixibacteraceae bacterium]